MSAQTLSQYPSSKIAQENLDMFADSWGTQINDLSIMVKEINDVCQGRGDKPVYLSLPRPGVRTICNKCNLIWKNLYLTGNCNQIVNKMDKTIFNSQHNNFNVNYLL